VVSTDAAIPLSDAPGTQSLGALSRGLVKLLHDRVGRGPTRAKAFWAGDDALLVLFSDVYTRAEKTLWAQGQLETARAYRQAVLDTLENNMRSVVEETVQRPVTTVMTCAQHDPDVMAVVFLLESLGGSGSQHAGRWGAGNSPAPHPDFAA
jgi:uncharacterized protein YbcI